jgi:hypothetical protein
MIECLVACFIEPLQGSFPVFFLFAALHATLFKLNRFGVIRTWQPFRASDYHEVVESSYYAKCGIERSRCCTHKTVE